MAVAGCAMLVAPSCDRINNVRERLHQLCLVARPILAAHPDKVADTLAPLVALSGAMDESRADNRRSGWWYVARLGPLGTLLRNVVLSLPGETWRLLCARLVHEAVHVLADPSLASVHRLTDLTATHIEVMGRLCMDAVLQFRAELFPPATARALRTVAAGIRAGIGPTTDDDDELLDPADRAVLGVVIQTMISEAQSVPKRQIGARHATASM